MCKSHDVSKSNSTSAQSNFNLSVCVTFQATPCYEADGWTLARTPGASHFNNQLLSIPLSAVVHYNKESRTYEAVETSDSAMVMAGEVCRNKISKSKFLATCPSRSHIT